MNTECLWRSLSALAQIGLFGDDTLQSHIEALALGIIELEQRQTGEWVDLCEHEGCKEPGLACFLPDDQDAPSYFYCRDHAQEGGFCSACGNFWGGVESFEFDPDGLCDNCRHDPDITGEEPDNEEDYVEDFEDYLEEQRVADFKEVES